MPRGQGETFGTIPFNNERLRARLRCAFLSLSFRNSQTLMMTRRILGLLLLALVALQPAAVQPAAAQQPAAGRPTLTLEDLFASAKFAGRSFQGGRWAAQGPVVTYIEADRASGGTDLVSYNLETDQRTTLIEGAALRAPDVGRLLQIEDYAYSRDGRKVLLYTDSEQVWRLNTKGFYYVYDLATKRLTPLAPRDKGFQMFAKFNPQGTHVAFVRDRNLFVVELASGQETQLTHDGSEGGLINGTTDWVYEEEFGLRDGFSWSPDGRYIAFFQFDEAATREFVMADLRGQYPELVRFRYPKAGETNSEVRVGVVELATRERRFFDTGTWRAGGDSLEYIPQMGWTPALDGGTPHVWMFRLDRDQNDLDLLYANPATGAVRTVLEETSPTWIDVETGFSDLDVGQITYLGDGRHFVWISERDGFRHLYLYTNDGRYVGRITQGPWDVTDFHGLDERRGVVYFTGTAESPTQRHLYRVAVDLRGRKVSTPTRITQRPGWHSVNPSSDLRYYIDTYSNATTPAVVTLHTMDGRLLKTLQDNQELIDTLAQYDLPPPEFMQVPGADGTPLNAYLIKPKNFDPSKRYPLLIHVYGGPGSQEVRDAWGGTERLWHHLLAERYGVLVAGIDNRGTGGRGRDFRGAVYKQLGRLEAEDQIAAAQWFGAQPYVDAQRMGIWGWSYGGYMTLMAMLTGEGPSTFKMGISVAPVTDWRQYDTIYTERFMSTPQKNAEGYDLGAPTRYAANLRDDQALLLVHGDFDDNVHFQNTVQMADALQAAGKQFDMMVYPGRNHGIYGGRTRLHLYTLMTNYIREHLVDDRAL